MSDAFLRHITEYLPEIAFRNLQNFICGGFSAKWTEPIENSL